MLTIDVPGWKRLVLEHLVLDFNGTLALDGKLLPGVRERLDELSRVLEIHVLTADTFGSVQDQMRGIALLQEEGAAPGTLAAADVVCRSICDALDLLAHPLRG